ncbi:MAG: DVUA0089 family protein [Planctomycetes bacterium]|nr:DVUA0089 family protein [Planctomycetota bacterium]
MKRIYAIAVTCSMFGMPAVADEWIEMGDAPPLIPGQRVIGPPNVDVEFIRGSFLGADDVDLYQILIHTPRNLNISTVDFTSADTQLFLFDINGDGVTHNDDNVQPGVGLQSRITSQFIQSAGIYYLAITQFNNDPFNPDDDLIWNNMPFRSERQPDGPGAPGPLHGWTTSNIGAANTYAIEMSGVHFVPEPGVLSLLALGGLLLRRRR